MTLFDEITLQSPMLRINNREQNINFYRDTLGFKVLHEENAMVFLGGYVAKQERLSLEESPSTPEEPFRSVDGPKKLQKITIKVENPQEIESLLVKGADCHRLFKGEKGYAFEAISPENDIFFIHAENHLEGLQEISKDGRTFQAPADFKGLSDFQVDSVTLNVADLERSQAFYQKLSGLSFLPALQEAQGEDLQVAPNTTWDIELFDYRVPKEYALADLKDYLVAQGLDIYLDKAERVLVVSDPSNIEIWFSK